jgi:hypothetical protein
MKKFTFSAAAIIAVAGVLASAPANAQSTHNGGGPIVNGDQCFSYQKGSGHDANFGTWAACPKTASTATTRAVTTTDKRGRKITRVVAVQGGAQRGGALGGGNVEFQQHQQGYWGY